jgi:hypothetical protein
LSLLQSTQGQSVTAPACVHLGAGWTEKQDDSHIDEGHEAKQKSSAKQTKIICETDHFKANTDYFN